MGTNMLLLLRIQFFRKRKKEKQYLGFCLVFEFGSRILEIVTVHCSLSAPL